MFFISVVALDTCNLSVAHHDRYCSQIQSDNFLTSLTVLDKCNKLNYTRLFVLTDYINTTH